MRAGFDRLHPKLAERFSVGLDSGLACIATGTMSRIWHGTAFSTPFLQLGASRHILFPEQGSDVPFTMENWPYLDRAGRETVTFNRTFELPRRRRRFDATMIFDEPTGRLVDYLGTHQHVAADLTCRADDHGGLVIRSGEQRFRMRRIDVGVPALITGQAEVHEWFDDCEGRFHIDVRVTNQWFGPLFGYRGSFTCRYVDLGQAPAPAVAKPAMEETRI
jgi:hypothetical protein